MLCYWFQENRSSIIYPREKWLLDLSMLLETLAAAETWQSRISHRYPGQSRDVSNERRMSSAPTVEQYNAVKCVLQGAGPPISQFGHLTPFEDFDSVFQLFGSTGV